MKLDYWHSFVAVARLKSFSKAALQQNVQVSTLSRQIKALEQRLGHLLFQRDSGVVRLTSTGEQYFAQLQPLFDEVDLALECLEAEANNTSGLIRLSAPLSVFDQILAPCIADFAQHYPNVRFDFTPAADETLIKTRQLDLVISAREPTVEHWVARQLVEVPFALFAAKSYWQRHAVEQLDHITELSKICLPQHQSWHFTAPEQVEVACHNPHWVTDPYAALALIKQGVGIGALPLELAQKQGDDLVAILPQWTMQSGALYLLYPDRSLLPKQVRAFIQHLDTYLAQPSQAQPSLAR